MRNQTDAVYLNCPILLDFGPKLDFFCNMVRKWSDFVLKILILASIVISMSLLVQALRQEFSFMVEGDSGPNLSKSGYENALKKYILKNKLALFLL